MTRRLNEENGEDRMENGEDRMERTERRGRGEERERRTLPYLSIIFPSIKYSIKFLKFS